MKWNTVLAINSFVFFPIVWIFMIYAAGRLIMFWDVKMFILALALVGLNTLAAAVLGILSE